MFDKIPSLKDFILYVIPGILICYFGLDILNILNQGTLTTEKISNDATISFVGIVFSFLIGFIFSQMQIIIFNKFLKNKFEKIRTIAESQKDNIELKKTLVERIKKTFEINGDFENDNLIVFACLNYVKIKTNEESQVFIDRQNNLSSFAMTIILPVILGIFDFLLRIKCPTLQMVIILLISILSLIYLISKIVVNFRDDYYKNIFRQFLVLSKDNMN
jgi:hypothetical protein